METLLFWWAFVATAMAVYFAGSRQIESIERESRIRELEFALDHLRRGPR